MKDLKWHATINEIKDMIKRHYKEHDEYPTKFKVVKNGKFSNYSIEHVDNEFILTNVESNFLAIGFNFRIDLDMDYIEFGDMIPYEVFLGRVDYINNL